MEANRKTYVHSGKSRPALSVDYCSASAQPITPDLSLLWGHEWAQQLQGLAGRATRKAVSPSALRFQGAWRSLALSNGHHLEPSYRSNTPAPKIEESKNSIDWAMHKWNYFSRQKSTVREILSLEMVKVSQRKMYRNCSGRGKLGSTGIHTGLEEEEGHFF